MQEDKGDISEDVHEDEDELHAWCLLEESENDGHRSCRACYAGRDVPDSETGPYEHSKEVRCSEMRKYQRLG